MIGAAQPHFENHKSSIVNHKWERLPDQWRERKRRGKRSNEIGAPTVRDQCSLWSDPYRVSPDAPAIRSRTGTWTRTLSSRTLLISPNRKSFKLKLFTGCVIADFVRSYDRTIQGRQEANSAGGGESLRPLMCNSRYQSALVVPVGLEWQQGVARRTRRERRKGHQWILSSLPSRPSRRLFKIYQPDPGNLRKTKPQTKSGELL